MILRDINDILSEQAANVYAALSLIFPAIPGWVAGQRAECLIKICKKVQQKLDKANIPKEQNRDISLKLGVSWIENASLEEDETLQEIWATYMTNILNPERQIDVIQTLFISIIKDLSPLDVKVLKIIYDDNMEKANNVFMSPDIAYIEHVLGIDEKYIDISIENLIRLGLITKIVEAESLSIEGCPTLLTTGPHVSELGFSFVEACMIDSTTKESQDCPENEQT